MWGESWGRLMNSALQTIILSTLSIKIKHVGRTISRSLAHTHARQTHREPCGFCATRRDSRGKFLWTRNRGKIRAISWRETFRENQHTGEPLNWLSGLELTSCPVRYQVPHHLAGSKRACVFTHAHTRTHADTHIGARESTCTWRRRSCADESGQSYHV